MSEHGCLSSAPCLLCSGFRSCRSQAAGLPSLKMRRSAGRSSGCLIFLIRSGLLAVCRLIFIFHPAAHGGGRGRSEPSRSHPTPLPRHHGRGARRCQVLPAPRRDPLGVYQASVRSFLCASMRAPQPATLPLIFGGAPERWLGMRLWLLLWRLGLAHALGLTCVALLVCGWTCLC